MCKAHRLLYHSTPGSRVMMIKKKGGKPHRTGRGRAAASASALAHSYLTESVDKVVLQKPIPAQILQLILYYF